MANVTDPLGQVERAQGLFEKGPLTAVAAFFALAFFVALFLLLREHKTHLAQVVAILEKERERTVKLELVAHEFLGVMADLRPVLAALAARKPRSKLPETGT